MLPLVLLAMSGCGLFRAVEELRDNIQNITNPLIAQGVILDLEMPDDPLLAAAVSDAGLQAGLTATVFVTEGLTVDDLDQALNNAKVSIEGVRATQGDAGVFSIWPLDGLNYQVGARWVLDVVRTDSASEGSMAITLPAAAPVVIPSEHVPGKPMVLDFKGLGYDSVLAYVFDVDGRTTWTNQPESGLEVFDLTQSTEAVKSLEIPGTAFPEDSIYAVAVAGMLHSDGTGIEGLNTLLSNLMAGQMQIYPVFTSPGLTTVGQILEIPEPDDPVLQEALARAELLPGTEATFFLADALLGAPSLEDAALPGGAVTLLTSQAFPTVDEGDGYYTLLADEGPPWVTGATWSVEVSHGPESGTLQVMLPGAPELILPPQHQANTALVVDLTGLDVDSAVVIVVSDAGDIVFSNEPQTVDEFAEVAARPDLPDAVTIPADVFAEPGLYGVALAAYDHAPPDDFSGVNPELSALMAGRMTVMPLPVTP
jgi:hypothetical protein